MRTLANVTFVAHDTDHSHSFNLSPVTPIWGCFLIEQVTQISLTQVVLNSEERYLGVQIQGRTLLEAPLG